MKPTQRAHSLQSATPPPTIMRVFSSSNRSHFGSSHLAFNVTLSLLSQQQEWCYGLDIGQERSFGTPACHQSCPTLSCTGTICSNSGSMSQQFTAPLTMITSGQAGLTGSTGQTPSPFRVTSSMPQSARPWRPYALYKAPAHTMTTRKEDVRSHQIFDIDPDALRQFCFIWWPSNNTKTLFWTNQAYTGSAWTSHSLADIPMTTATTWAGVDPTVLPAPAAYVGHIQPTPLALISDHMSRVRGCALRFRAQIGSPQNVTARIMVPDPGLSIPTIMETARTSDYARTISTRSGQWYTVTPDTMAPHLLQEFHNLEPHVATGASFYATAITFPFIESPSPTYASKIQVEVEAVVTVEHRLPDQLRHLGTMFRLQLR